MHLLRGTVERSQHAALPLGRVRRNAARALGGLMLAATGITCFDAPPTAPGAAARTGGLHLAIAPKFQSLPPGAPVIPLSKIRGVLSGISGDTTVSEALFQGDSAILVFDVTFSGSTGTFDLDMTAYDMSGQIAYTGHDTIHVNPGDNAPVQPATALQYAAPDASVMALHVVPDPVQLNSGQTGGLAVTGTNASNQPISPIHVGWTSRNPDIASVDGTGTVQASTFEGTTWVVARTATNVADSTLVAVHAAVAGIAIAPASTSVVRGDSVQLVATLTDAGGHPITNRSAAWSSSDASTASVGQSGWVKGAALGGASITATAEGKSAAATVTVVTPVEGVSVAPSAVTLTSLTATQPFTAAPVPKPGVAIARVGGLPVSWKTSAPAIASVDNSGNVTAVTNGTATITATIDGVDGSTTVNVKQSAVALHITPKTGRVTALKLTQAFLSGGVDAKGQLVPEAFSTWSSLDPTVASVDANGVATSLARGTARIVVSNGALADTAMFSVFQAEYAISAFATPGALTVGQSAQIKAEVDDINGQAVAGAPLAYASLTPSIVTVTASGVIQAISGGTGQVQVTSGPLAQTISISVTGASATTMSLNLNRAEKLPNGTQTFSVVTGNPGPYIWSVNGVDGGNSTFGTITQSEAVNTANYRAPGSVPSPSSFPVCARRQVAPAEQGCATVTIDAVPTAGADVVVFNDLNMFDNYYGAPDSLNNGRLFKNLVNFSGAGSRGAGTKVLVYFGHGSVCGCAGQFGSWSTFEATMSSQGYTVFEGSDETTPITSIDPAVKVLVLALPTVAFDYLEINALKQFAADGGRIVWVGEYDGYYGAGIAVENQFFTDIGAVMRNLGSAYDCGLVVLPASSLRSHQIMTGLTDLSVACASEVQLGPNDFALFYDDTNAHVLGAVAKIDLTPLPPPTNLPSLRRGPATAPRVVDPNVH